MQTNKKTRQCGSKFNWGVSLIDCRSCESHRYRGIGAMIRSFLVSILLYIFVFFYEFPAFAMGSAVVVVTRPGHRLHRRQSTVSSGTGSVYSGTTYSTTYSYSTQASTPSTTSSMNVWQQNSQMQTNRALVNQPLNEMRNAAPMRDKQPVRLANPQPSLNVYPFKPSLCYSLKHASTNTTLSRCVNCIPGIPLSIVTHNVVNGIDMIWRPQKLADNTSFVLAAQDSKYLLEVQPSLFKSAGVQAYALTAHSTTINSWNTWTWKNGTLPNTYQFRLVQNATTWLGACPTCQWNQHANVIPEAYQNQTMLNANPQNFDFYLIPHP